jgi:hypothetical protein
VEEEDDNGADNFSKDLTENRKRGITEQTEKGKQSMQQS